MRLEEDVVNPSKDRLNTDADGYVKWHMRDPLKVIEHLLSKFDWMVISSTRW